MWASQCNARSVYVSVTCAYRAVSALSMRLFSSSDKHSLQKIRSQHLVQINLVADLIFLVRVRQNSVHMSKYTIFRNRVRVTQCTEILCIWVSILFLEIEFKQLNSILSWARVERDQLNLNLNSDLSWIDLSQLNSTLTRRQI